MAQEQVMIGRGTQVFVAPLPKGRVAPPAASLVVGTGGAVAAATSIPITTTGLTEPLYAPFWISFTAASGLEMLARVTADVEPGDTTATVDPLPEAIPVGSTGAFPLRLKNRTAANLSDSDSQADVMVFDNDGWRDQVTTMLGNGLELPGHYSPKDPGWKTCWEARQNFDEIYWKLVLPVPQGYTSGHIFEGFGGVTMPIEVPADGIISANITVTSRGPVTITEPEV
jgi:hypothetical protein